MILSDDDADAFVVPQLTLLLLLLSFLLPQFFFLYFSGVVCLSICLFVCRFVCTGSLALAVVVVDGGDHPSLSFSL